MTATYADLQAERWRLYNEAEQYRETDPRRRDRLQHQGAETHWEAWEAGMRELYGLRPNKRGAICLWRVAGVRHIHTYGTSSDCLADTRHGHDHLWDHVALWRGQDGEVVITAEPYNEVESVDLDAICAKYGVRYENPAESPWYPSSTHLYIFRKAVA